VKCLLVDWVIHAVINGVSILNICSRVRNDWRNSPKEKVMTNIFDAIANLFHAENKNADNFFETFENLKQLHTNGQITNDQFENGFDEAVKIFDENYEVELGDYLVEVSDAK
jgi:hypothetical protein